MLELGQDLLAGEGRDLDVEALFLQYAHLVLQRLVRVIERVPELVAGEDDVVSLRLVGGRCSGSIARPTAQEPSSRHSIQRTTRSGAPPSSRPATTRSAKRLDDESPRMGQGYNRSMARIGDFIRNLFATTKSSNERISAYIVREHDRGRTLDDILDDPYVVNRCSPDEIARILERREVITALGSSVAEAAKQSVDAQSS